jgi:hypothetical protein
MGVYGSLTTAPAADHGIPAGVEPVPSMPKMMPVR